MLSILIGGSDTRVPMSEDNLSGILQCFQPVFLFMRFLGIELDPRFHKKINLYGLIVVAVGMWTISDHTATIYWRVSLPLTHPNSINVTSTTSSWNVGIDYANHFFFIVAIYPTIFYIARNRWKTLWDVVEELDSTLCHKLNYSHLRKLFYIGLVPILGEVIFIFYNMQWISRPVDQTTYRLIVTYIASLAKAVPISALVLYCAISWLNSLFYEQIYLDVFLKHNKTNQANICKWKQELNLASELVNEINKCFGLVLFVSVSHYFIDLVAHFFYLVNAFTDSQRNKEFYDEIYVSMHFGNILLKFLFLWFVAYTPSRIRCKIAKIAFILHRIDNVELNLQSQICLLWSDMLRSLPEVSALGYFNIGLHLIPKLVGTTITYLIILYEFTSSERKQ